ncbi:ANK_REP_REGION domain-containing protein, partial [Trichonephila clavata]
MPETYPTGGAKNFIHGIDYQKLWLMLFFRRAVNRKYFFRLATEMSSAAGFDDVVFRYEQNGTTVFEKIETQDEFLNIGDSAKYKLRDLRNNITQCLKQRMSAGGREVSDEEIKGFLNELVFVVNSPNDAELEKLIRNEISDDLARRFKYFGDDDSVLNALSTMMSSWMKDKRGRFLTPEEGEKFFREVEKLPSTLGRIELVLEEIKKGLDSMMGEKSASDNTQQAHFHKEPIWFNMRYPVKTFTGRRSELQKIHKELHKTTGEQAEVSQIVVISGLGGI